jgi:RND superfamily putative drug exporter
VTNDDNISFLPSSEPSVRAARLAVPFQHGILPESEIVVARNDSPLTAADEAAITRTEAVVRRVTGVVDVRDQGISRDGYARKAQVTLNGNAQGPDRNKYVDAIRAALAKPGAPAGLFFYLTGEFATSLDNSAASSTSLQVTALLSIVLILALLFAVYRAVLAPILTFVPPLLALLVAGPIIAESHKLFGVAFSSITQIFLVVLLLGAGTDYGLFFVFRMREERRRGLDLHVAVVKSLSRVGETITFSASTVVAAMVCLLLASFGFYQGLGPAIAIGIAILLLAGLTLLPALFAIFGRAAFWPTWGRTRQARPSFWGRVAGRIVRRPALVLVAGVAAFAALAG